MRVTFFVVLISALAACQDEETFDAPTACGAEQFQSLVGAMVSDHSFPEGTRIIDPDTAVTMEFNPERLNIETDANGTIKRVYCS